MSYFFNREISKMTRKFNTNPFQIVGRVRMIRVK